MNEIADDWETFVAMARELPDHWAAKRWPVQQLDDPPEAFRAAFLAGMTKLADERHPGIRRMVARQLDALYRNERVREAAVRVRSRSRRADPVPLPAGRRLMPPGRLAVLYPSAVANVQGRRTWDRALDELRRLAPDDAPMDASTLRRWVTEDGLRKPWELP